MSVLKEIGQSWKQICYSLIASFQLIMIGISITWSTPAYEHISSNHSKRLIFNNNATEIVPAFSPQAMALLFGLPQFIVSVYLFIFLFINIQFSPKIKIIIFSKSSVIFWIIMLFGDQTYYVFLIARIIAGIGFLNLLEVSLYIEEITEGRIRGALVTLTDCSINVGIMIGLVIGSSLTFKNYSIMALILSFLTWSLSLLLPESPIWCMMNGNKMKVKGILQKLRYSKHNFDEELDQITVYLKDIKKYNLKELGLVLLRKRQYRQPFLVVMFLFLFQQTTAVGVTQNYAIIILRRANDQVGEFLTLLIAGVGGLLSSVIASSLSDNVGRRPLLISSFLVVIMCLGSLAIYTFLQTSMSLLPKIAIPLHISAINAGLGPIPYVVMSEILPVNIRRVGSILGVLIMSLTNSLAVVSFSTLSDLISESFVFMFYTVINIIGFVFVWFCVPETKKIPRHLMQQTLYLKTDNREENHQNV